MLKKPVLFVLLLSGWLPAAVLQADVDPDFKPIPQQTLLDYLSGKTNFTLIDARTADEYEAGHIWGAGNIPPGGDLDSNEALPADKASPLVVYCKSGLRAEALQADLQAAGYDNVRVLAPAQMLWAGELPVFNCGAVAEPAPPLVTVARPAATGGTP